MLTPILVPLRNRLILHLLTQLPNDSFKRKKFGLPHLTLRERISVSRETIMLHILMVWSRPHRSHHQLVAVGQILAYLTLH